MELNPMDKIESLIETGRSFRNFSSFDTAPPKDSNDMIAEGVACVFNQATVLYSYDGIDYKEIVDSRAFDGCDLSDCILNYDHQGKVMARTRNKTLELNVGTNGLNIRAQLNGSADGRTLYEEIKNGLIDRMSFAFTVSDEDYNQDTHTRTIKSIKKLYDVSAVGYPAYSTTSINVRSLIKLDREIKDKLDSLNVLRKRKLILALKIEGGPTYE